MWPSGLSPAALPRANASWASRLWPCEWSGADRRRAIRLRPRAITGAMGTALKHPPRSAASAGSALNQTLRETTNRLDVPKTASSLRPGLSHPPSAPPSGGLAAPSFGHTARALQVGRWLLTHQRLVTSIPITVVTILACIQWSPIQLADSGPSRTVIPAHCGQQSGDCGQFLMSV
jgi:hypothetical protein